jgi:glutaredoxin
MHFLLKLLPGLLLALQPAAAEIYRWVDVNGKVHFGDAPPRNGVVQRVEPRVNSYRPVISSPHAVSGETVESKPRVVMYSTRWCGYCKQARAYFNQESIRFSERDIERSADARRAYDRLGGQGVPLILVGEQQMSGFSIERFRRLYGRQVSQSTSR